MNYSYLFDLFGFLDPLFKPEKYEIVQNCWVLFAPSPSIECI